MKDQPLSNILAQIEKFTYRASLLERAVEKAEDTTRLHFKTLELKQSKDALKFYQGLLKDFGSHGELTLVQGKVWDGSGEVKILEEFKMYLSCSMEEAKKIFEAQVAQTKEFLPETISYTTIPLKHLILT